MKSDYGIAVAYEILDMVAYHPTLVIRNMQLSTDEGKSWTTLKLEKKNKKKANISEREQKLAETQRHIAIISKDINQIRTLFDHFDNDGVSISSIFDLFLNLCFCQR